MSAQNRVRRVQAANLEALTAYAIKLRKGLGMFETAQLGLCWVRFVLAKARVVCRTQTMRPPAKLFTKLLRTMNIPDEDARNMANVAAVLSGRTHVYDFIWVDEWATLKGEDDGKS